MNIVKINGIDAIVVCGQIVEEYWAEMSALEGHELTDAEKVRLRSHMALKFVDPTCSVNIAVSDDGIHGFCVIGVSDKFCRDNGLVAEIHDIYVAKESRGTVEAAIGLYNAAESWAKELGCICLEGNVSLFNHRVASYLSKRGFSPIEAKYSKSLEEDDGIKRSKTVSKKRHKKKPVADIRREPSHARHGGAVSGVTGLRGDRGHTEPDSGEADELRRPAHSKADGGGSGSSE